MPLSTNNLIVCTDTLISIIRFLFSQVTAISARELSSSTANINMPLKHIPASKLYVSEPNPSWFGNPSNEGGNPYWGTESTNWLKSRFHFSFAEYSSSKNSNFGVLRVMNDDFVQPARGFGTAWSFEYGNRHIHSKWKIDTQGYAGYRRNAGTGECTIHDCWEGSTTF